MNAKTHAKSQKPHAKEIQKTVAPYPNFITQVNKEDENKSSFPNFTTLYRCCSMLWRCLPVKKQNFTSIEDSVPGLLEPQLPQFKGRKTLVLDLDETLVHSTFEPVSNPDLVLPVKIQGMTYKINVIKRPGVEEFLARVGDLFEVVIFTASLAEYAEPLVRILDTTNAVSSLLYRQHCTPLNGIYVKDMTLLGRDLKDIILVDNSPNSFLFQPENAYHIRNFFDDKTDRDLDTLANFLDHMVRINDVRPIEELRKKYEPQHPPKSTVKFVKVKQESVDMDPEPIHVVDPSKQTLKKKEEREKSYNIETEPDMRKDEDDERVPQYNFYGRSAITERIVVNDRFVPQPVDSSMVDIELPSPKESDNLINHREVGEYFDENNSNETDSEKKKDRKDRPLVPPFAQSAVAGVFGKKNKQVDIVAVPDPSLEGQHVEDVRYHTGIDNLNSPLGRQVKIEFKNQMGMTVSS